MKTRYKITLIVFGISLAIIIGMTSGTTCILVDGTPPGWLGSENGCGPLLTYEIQKYFEILW